MITKHDLKFLKLAETIAKYSDYPRINIGACVVHKKSVISTGTNRLKSHPEQLKYDSLLPFTKRNHWIHAEMDSLVKAGDESYGATLYVLRRGRDGVLQSCKPCASCMGKIVDSGIRRVVYTVRDGIMEMSVS